MKKPKNILCIGATSAIAQAVLRLYAVDGASFILVGRNLQKVEVVADDLMVRGAGQVDAVVCDFEDGVDIKKCVNAVLEKDPSLDLVLIAHGSLGEQKLSEKTGDVVAREIFVNFTSHVLFLTPLANHLESKKHGSIALIGSVAGDRGRQSNYVYGSCKGALHTFLQGLRNRLFKSGVHVLEIKPGFVDSPMTTHLSKGPLFASPEYVASSICNAIARHKDELYTPCFWWGIMLIIRSIPECIFKRLKL